MILNKVFEIRVFVISGSEVVKLEINENCTDLGYVPSVAVYLRSVVRLGKELFPNNYRVLTSKVSQIGRGVLSCFVKE